MPVSTRPCAARMRSRSIACRRGCARNSRSAATPPCAVSAVAPARGSLRYAAAGFAALCALAIGLQFGSMPAPASLDPGIASTSATPDTTMLDEDPEFYAWLASADAQQIAME
jgi:hypothetical protein